MGAMTLLVDRRGAEVSVSFYVIKFTLKNI
jgi:hypothetical protein